MIKSKWGLDINKIQSHLEDYKNNSEQKYNYQDRIDSYEKAKNILEEMISVEVKSEDDFMNYYEQLVGAEDLPALWHSGSLFRQKNKVALNYKGFIEYVKDVKKLNVESAAEAFQLIHKYVDKITGLGINVPTEVLNNFYPDKYAVLNKLTINVLRYFGCSKFPADANSFKPSDYEEYNKVISYLMKLCGFNSMGQVDHFLNYIYWEENPELPTPEEPEPEHAEYMKIIDYVAGENTKTHKILQLSGSSEHCVYFQKYSGEDILYFGLWVDFYKKYGKPICYGVDENKFNPKTVAKFREIHQGKYIEYKGWLLIGIDESTLKKPGIKKQLSQAIEEELRKLSS